MNQKRVRSIADIAELLGVSESTVSRALNDNPLVNQKTREKIQALAKEHNFKINAKARALRTQKTRVIAVVVLFKERTERGISDPFLLDILGAIADELTLHGYDMLLSNTRTASDDWGNYYFDSKRADGLIVIGQGEHDARIDNLAREDFPFVVWGAALPDSDYCTVGSDNKMGAFMAVNHLINQGCKRIAFFGDISHSEMEQRWQGYCLALQQARIALDESLRFDTDFTSEAGYQSACRLLAQSSLTVDGLFAVSDVIALGAMKKLTEAGIGIPGQVAVVGFDDVAMSMFYQPSLTTIRQQTLEGGRLLVNKLLDKLAGKAVRSQLLDVQLVVRESSKRE
ncbi:LacI family DNA-binding transcriptional regulator [Aliiglaciecola sp. CAU 1673]|uniref:LacI family DNA-binding transcriptional regulator n=1 Tax=Aliiglaciecola sp. CAU 1673 TaxID=3032595 RepID=UPI0023D9E8E6|nr:LacI family DNA-binding transcriptional regulator [Aliiglaciecola sp. CAU 1673]MDF2178496.1 LacI family DNA-binding transcriptional regulator [Aliiglaciecola sp. CAU 1673]